MNVFNVDVCAIQNKRKFIATFVTIIQPLDKWIRTFRHASHSSSLMFVCFRNNKLPTWTTKDQHNRTQAALWIQSLPVYISLSVFIQYFTVKPYFVVMVHLAWK